MKFIKYEGDKLQEKILLTAAYKLLATLIQKRLIKNVKGRIGSYQSGFVKERSTEGEIYLIKEIMEKACKWMKLMFIDFQRAIDSNKRNKYINLLVKIKVKFKLMRLMMMTMKSTTIKEVQELAKQTVFK